MECFVNGQSPVDDASIKSERSNANRQSLRSMDDEPDLYLYDKVGKVYSDAIM